jgi:hypothetical protein
MNAGTLRSDSFQDRSSVSFVVAFQIEIDGRPQRARRFSGGVGNGLSTLGRLSVIARRRQSNPQAQAKGA